MSKVIASLEKVLLPFAVKIGKQPHVNAIKNGFIKLMPLTLAGAMFVLINNVFLSFGEGSFFYSLGIRLDASTIETLNGLKAIGGNVYNGTLGIMSLMAPFFIGMALAEERKVDPLAAGLLSIAAFMTVTPYSVGALTPLAPTGWVGQTSFPVLLSGWWWPKCSPSLFAVTGLSACRIAFRPPFLVHFPR